MTRTWWPSLNLPPTALLANAVAGVRSGNQVMVDPMGWLMVRRGLSERQVLERMTDFWEGLLHVPASHEESLMWRIEFGDLIRTHALGRFDQMLVAAITHPAMLLELHTVGIGSYSEADVTSSARILTGYGATGLPVLAASYTKANHWTGAVTVGSFSDANASPDRRATAVDYLTYLARHPATARRIASRLVTKFVSDAPFPALVDRLAAVYLSSGTDIKALLRSEWSSPDLQVTTDYRSVLSEVVMKRFGASSAQVFPGFTPETVGAMS